MNGRIRNEMMLEKSVEKKIKDLPDFVTNWYLNLRASKKTGATCLDYITKIDRFLSYINSNTKLIRPSDITADTVTRYFLSTQTKVVDGEIAYTSDSYQQTVWCCLNSFLDYLYRNDLIARNYIQDITKPRNKDLERINEHRVRLGASDFKKIMRAVAKENRQFNRVRDKAILYVFMGTGMRKTALSNIMLDDVDMINHTLAIVDKGNKAHKYDLADDACDAIADWLTVRKEMRIKKDDNLFLSNRGTALGSSSLQDIVGKYTEAALGKRLSPHKLRSGYCSILYEKSGDIEFVRRAVGHANSATTQRYIVTKGDEKKRAAEIMANILR